MLTTSSNHALKSHVEDDCSWFRPDWYIVAREAKSLKMRHETSTTKIDEFMQPFERMYIEDKLFKMNQYLHWCLEYWKKKVPSIDLNIDNQCRVLFDATLEDSEPAAGLSGLVGAPYWRLHHQSNQCKRCRNRQWCD